MSPVDLSAGLRRPLVGPSAPLELLWVGHQLLNPQHFSTDHFAALGQQRKSDLASRLDRFWNDGVSGGAAEFVILADLAGDLLAERLDGLLEQVPADAGRNLRLRSEDPGDRIRMVERVGRLQREPKLWQTYLALMREIWGAVQDEWLSVGLPMVRRASDRVVRALERGDDLVEAAAPAMALVRRKRADWAALVDEGTAEGRLALIPSFFGGSWSLWDLPEHMVVGFDVSGRHARDLEEAGRSLAPRLRALSDPTRLNLLVHLANHPTSVGELAQMFSLAQPTVSAHLRVLREAGLVDGARQGGRTIYRSDARQLGRLLRETAERTSANLGA